MYIKLDVTTCDLSVIQSGVILRHTWSLDFCAHGSQVWRKTSKLISSFPRGWKDKGQTERTPRPWEREVNMPHILFRNGLRGALLLPFSTSSLFWATGLSCAHPTTALGMCYDNWKRWTARARSGMNRSQGVWHVGVGEKDLCWEVSSLKIQQSTEVPSGSHGKLSGPISDCCAEVNELSYHWQTGLVTAHCTNWVKGCLNLLCLLMVSLILPSPSFIYSRVMEGWKRVIDMWFC